MAFEAGEAGGTLPVVMNAANEEAVYAFLDKKISLWQIYEITRQLMEKHSNIINPELDEIFEIDRITRKTVWDLTNK